MGYANGSEVFNAVAEVVLEVPIGEESQYRILKALWSVLEDEGWDTQDEVSPKSHPVIKRLYRENMEAWDQEFPEHRAYDENAWYVE